MAQGNNAKRQGANSHELYVLQALNRIVVAINGQSAPLPVTNVFASSTTTGLVTIPAGSKAVTIYVDGIGAEVNGVLRPNGWSQSIEHGTTDLVPAFDVDGHGTATIYIDTLT